jgi:hypothetical protein
MRLLIITLFMFLSGGITYSQDCGSDEEVDWRTVEIRIMMTKQSEPIGYSVTGEATVKIKKTISSIEDLSPKEKEEIKKKAAKYGSCLVYIDTNGLWDSPNFPTMASQNLLYYYWVKKE